MDTFFDKEKMQWAMKVVPSWLTAVLTIVLSIMLAKLFWLVVTPVEKVAVREYQPQNINSAATKIEDFGSQIANLHLFGEEPKKAANLVVAHVPVQPVKTRLELDLHGVLSRDDNNSYAIISHRKGEQKVYGVGEEPQTGATIENIYPTKVVLKYSGQLEELLLPENVNASSRGGSLPVPSRRNNLPSAPPMPIMPDVSLSRPPEDMQPETYSAPPDESVAIQDASANTLPEEDLGALRDALTTEPERLLEIANATEAKDKDGKLIGFRLTPGSNRNLFRQLGLRPGDIATSVNGISLDSQAQALAVMSELSSASSIAITVQRGDQEVTIAKEF